MNKHVVFDFDGTIANSLGIGIELYNEMAEKYGLRKIKGQEEYSQLSKLPIMERLKIFNVPLYKLPKLGVEFKKNYQRFASSLQVFDGIKEIIFKLKDEGYSLSIISSNSVANIEHCLRTNGLDVFDRIVSSRGIFGKHSTINSLIKKLNINNKDVVYIGDELRDIVSCKKSDVKIIAVSWGLDSVELLTTGKPDFIAHNPSEIMGFVKAI